MFTKHFCWLIVGCYLWPGVMLVSRRCATCNHGPGVTSPHCSSQICFSFLHSSTRDPCLLTPALRTPLHIRDKINIWKYKYVESDISCSITWLHPTQLENEGTIQMHNNGHWNLPHPCSCPANCVCCPVWCLDVYSPGPGQDIVFTSVRSNGA